MRTIGMLQATKAAMLVLLLAVSAAPAQTPAPATVNLQPKFVEGRVSRYDVWTHRARSMTGTFGGNSQSYDTKFDITGQVTWSVSKVNSDGSAECVMTIDWLAMTITLPDGTVQVNDSRRGSGDTEQVQSLLKAMSTVPITCDVNADGSVSRVRGTDAIRSRADADANVPEDLDFIESASDLATLPFAPAQTSPGKPWKVPFEWSHELGMMRFDTTFTLAGVEEIAGIPVATVTSSSALQLTVDRSKVPADGPPVDVRLRSGSASSQVMFDLQRGEAVGRNSMQSTQLEIRMDLQGQTMTQTINETIQSQALRVSE